MHTSTHICATCRRNTDGTCVRGAAREWSFQGAEVLRSEIGTSEGVRPPPWFGSTSWAALQRGLKQAALVRNLLLLPLHLGFPNIWQRSGAMIQNLVPSISLDDCPGGMWLGKAIITSSDWTGSAELYILHLPSRPTVSKQPPRLISANCDSPTCPLAPFGCH